MKELSPIRDPEAWEWDGRPDDQCWTWLDMVVWYDGDCWWCDCDATNRHYGYDPSGKRWMFNDPKCRWPVALLRKFAAFYPKGHP